MTRMWKALMLGLTLSAALIACTSNDVHQLAKVVTAGDPSAAAESWAKDKATEYAANPGKIETDLKGIAELLSKLRQAVDKTWEEDAKYPGTKVFVKYWDNYRSRAEINFEEGWVRVETLAGESEIAKLEEAIVTTLLTPDDPAKVDVFSDKPLGPSQGEPFLYQQVVDDQGQPIRWEWRAKRYASYLSEHKLERKQVGKFPLLAVQFPLVSQHEQLREYRYQSLIEKYAKHYDVPESLIYAVMKTESSFNPYAVSHAGAFGLMQVVPSTAGRDVFDKVKGKPGQPTQQYLFVAENNIDVGTAYLHLLETRYLKAIDNPTSRHYSVISAYNGGAGNVFKTFHSNRSQAPQAINGMSPASVYQKLTTQHPAAESRRYLQKVDSAEQAFRRGEG